MKIYQALVGILALGLAGALRAETFEGRVTMKLSSSNAAKDAPQSITYALKEGFIRVEMATPRGQMVSIMDLRNHQILVLMPQQRMYMVQPLPQAAAPAAGQGNGPLGSDVQVTSEKATILGYTCTKLLATHGGSTSEVWVTDQLGSFLGLSPGAGGPGRRSAPPQAWESALKGRSWFPMRVVTKDGAKATFQLEVTHVEKASIPDSEFAPPDGWQKFDIASMMGGAFPGARPADNN